jgi:WD40 repeat protein
MAMSPDGSLLATGSHDRTARVWDWKSGKNIATHPVDGFLLSVAFLRGGERMCCATQEGSVTCWDTRTGEQIWQQKNLMQLVFSMCTAPHRPIGALLSEIDGLALLDLQSGEVTAHIGDKRNQMRSAAFDSTGHLIAVGGHDETVRLFDVDTGTELRRFTGHSGWIEGVAFDAADARVASGDVSGLVLVHDVATGRELARLTGTSGNVRTVQFSRDGKRLLVTGQLGMELWDLDANQPLESRAQFRQRAFAALIAPGDEQIVSGSLAGAIRVWEIASDSAVRSLPLKFERQGYFAMHPDCRTAARDVGDGKVEVVDLDTGIVSRTLETGFKQITQVLYEHPGGKHLAVLSGPTRISMWDDTGEHHLCSIETESSIGTLRFSPDGKRIAVTTDGGIVRLYDPDTGAKIEELQETNSVMERPAFSPDGKRLATTHRGKLVEIWRLDPPQMERKISTPRAVYSIAFDPRGEQLWVGTWDGHVLVYGANDGTLIRTLEGHVQQVASVIPRRDGSLFATTGGDGVIRLWSPDAAVSLVALDAHAGNVLSFLITADGKKIRSVYFDGTVRDWDLSYYDRHIEGNQASQRARFAAEGALDRR